MLKEFQEFMSRGNVLDLAVAVIIGTAFGAVIKSLVDDVLMPPIGRILGNVNFSNLFINLSGGSYTSLADAQKAGAATINYGLFLNTVISFLIIALVVFMIVRAINQMQRSKTEASPPPSKSEELLTEIRDLLKQPRA